jgi:hypothetical protein
MLTLSQIRFCAIECKLQQSGEHSVADMCDALHWAIECSKQELPLTVAMIRRLGQKVEPSKNEHGFRKMPVYFENDRTRQALNPVHIERGLNSLLEHSQYLSADDRYLEFQKIHPFNDGNGRVGAILWNVYWNGGDNMEYPEIPPNFFANPSG